MIDRNQDDKINQKKTLPFKLMNQIDLYQRMLKISFA